MSNFSISQTTQEQIPNLPFSKIKEAILGKHYELSLVFIGDTLSRRLNRTYRAKDKPTNILSFPISESSGEIFINLKRAKPFSPGYLFIHGALHLKGMQHSATMDKAEIKFLKKFNLTHNEQPTTNK